MAKDNESIRVFHDARLDDLELIRKFVRETVASTSSTQSVTQSHAASENMDELIVAVNEAAANILRHGYQDSAGTITVIVTSTNRGITVTLLDNAPHFDPTLAPSPNMTLPLEKRPFGGMGIHMMKEFCDELSYRHNEKGQNELTLVKYVNDPTRLDQS